MLTTNSPRPNTTGTHVGGRSAISSSVSANAVGTNEAAPDRNPVVIEKLVLVNHSALSDSFLVASWVVDDPIVKGCLLDSGVNATTFARKHSNAIQCLMFTSATLMPNRGELR
jgi:hypothetical protein